MIPVSATPTNAVATPTRTLPRSIRMTAATLASFSGLVRSSEEPKRGKGLSVSDALASKDSSTQLENNGNRGESPSEESTTFTEKDGERFETFQSNEWFIKK
ncbi:hypothetical protein DSL72_007116 [Monilinia vaccinii-corymbosi]|uniref:Uncharacterized protein n=1 Tax=Monilinia vaccinii-corymbosi TaxID=61207 RepID=A0A8A3PM32_9HELO|nr:hypothetical protein DSL72_007116 [Monilinia vaccinii-corymbosi]